MPHRSKRASGARWLKRRSARGRPGSPLTEIAGEDIPMQASMPKLGIRKTGQVFVRSRRRIVVGANVQPLYEPIQMGPKPGARGHGRHRKDYRRNGPCFGFSAGRVFTVFVGDHFPVRAFPKARARDLVVVCKKRVGHSRFAHRGDYRLSDYVLLRMPSHQDKP